MKTIQIINNVDLWKKIKSHSITAIISVLITIGVYFFIPNDDKKIDEIKSARDNIVLASEDARRRSNESKEIFLSEVEKNRKLAEQLEEQVIDSSKNLTTLENYAKYTKALVNQNKHLKSEISIRDARIEELNLELENSYNLQEQTLRELNKSLALNMKYSKKDKAMKIGLGVSIPLALVGGAIAGFYVTGAIPK